VELPITSIRTVWVKGGETMCIIGVRSYKATKAKGFRGNMQKNIKWVGGNNVGELRNKSGGRWRRIPGLGGGIGIESSRRKSRGRLRI
jgi:hypothetical protein